MVAIAPFQLLRLARVGFVLAREGAFALVDPNEAPPAVRALIRIARLVERRGSADSAERLVTALTRLGPSYIKLGQFMATRPDVVGVRVARDLERLQDRIPPFAQSDAIHAIEAAFGKPLDQVFAEFSQPIAAASIAQVHRATTLQGETVAVKVLRPNVRYRFRRDLGAMAYAAALLESLSAEARRLKFVDVVETLSRSVTMEMDLRLEAAALSEMAENTRDDPDFRVPTVNWDLTAREILTMEWIDGTPLHDIDTIVAKGHDRIALGRTIIQSFLRQALRDGFFHADMHPGNLFIDENNRLCAVDFGIMGRLGLKERRFLAEILLGFITRNYRRVAEVHFEAGYVPARHSVDDFAQAIRAIGEPIHQRSADQISMAKLLTLLFEVTGLFDMRTRTELVMLQKTMVVVEGVSRALDPHLNMWTTAEPVVREWIEKNLGPIGRIQDLGRNAASFAGMLAHLPAIASRAETLGARIEEAADKGFPLDERSIAAIGRAEAKRARWGNLALWIIAITLALIAARLI